MRLRVIENILIFDLDYQQIKEQGSVKYEIRNMPEINSKIRNCDADRMVYKVNIFPL